jgi:hypothetical protein
VAFRESDEEAATLVKNAWAANQHVPAILPRAKPAVGSDDGYEIALDEVERITI